MLTDTQKKYIDKLRYDPVGYAHLLGFDKLTDIHNDWMRLMINSKQDETLLGHRASYKTTCVSVALAILIILKPNTGTLFMRKTDDDITEIVTQVKKILLHPVTQYITQQIYGKPLKLVKDNSSEITTNLMTSTKGSVQLLGVGMKGSLTGKHFDRIFTDDIVNVKDRISRAERDYTKTVYQELQNIKNREGRFFNTGTPWHKEDAISLMPNVQRFDCYSTGIIDKEQLQAIRDSMTSSLFAANYELKHIAAEDVMFNNPQFTDDVELVYNGVAHIDAAYGGEDSTAFTVINKKDGKYYVFGKSWRKHVDDCTGEIIQLRTELLAGSIYCENNGDKGYLAKELRKQGEKVHVYHEDMNKFLKISTYLKAVWKDVVFIEGTDADYINEILDYTEQAEHDDSPDSLASIVRKLYFKKEKGTSNYVPVWG